ncbi:hypothetical protein [Qipengyuania oceanensis]|uniref:HNH endonuclease n=1 Tax=Qipengyuania oceanensis TaxID=1463597 RepID=A0A844YHN6_9SPHN|nr:hypothetical protein [Qipengyuania oceanensis]MXO63412.1 hypothetical protein [Qipengyuania oceanensis]
MATRDNFSKRTRDRLARRVGMRCSFPQCRAPTSGPDAEKGTTDTGVAAHITAASPDGPRYDDTISSAQRASIENGIWLCQNHAKLIDDDELTYTAAVLRDYRDTAEQIAGLEAKGFRVVPGSPFAAMERKASALVAEMREDMKTDATVRRFALLDKRFSYGAGSEPQFVYYYNTHANLDSLVAILENYGAVREITSGNVRHFRFNESFVDYLLE